VFSKKSGRIDNFIVLFKLSIKEDTKDTIGLER
jgi:hypothetical protein